MTVLMRTFAAVLLAVTCLAAPLVAQAQTPQAQTPKQQDEFTPVSELPPQEQLAAAPLLIAAYAFVLLVFFLYVVSLARRLTHVQRDVDRLGAALKQSTKP